MSNPDDLVLTIEIDEESKTWVLTVKASNGRKVDETEFIMEIECWLTELSRAHDGLSDPKTQIH